MTVVPWEQMYEGMKVLALEHAQNQARAEAEVTRLRAVLKEIARGLSVRHPFDIANEALNQ